MTLLALSFLANLVLTTVVAVGIYRNHPGISEVFGQDSPARRILGCVYATIGLISLYALGQMALGQSEVALTVAVILFPLQILYKLMTAVALRPLHPVVIANLCFATLLALTLLLL